MKKNGFTLIEIIGAIVMLGILAILAFATFSGSIKGFRDSYYKDTIRTIEKAGKEFFTDNRNYRPSKILNAQEVQLNTLVTKNYIDDVVDYNGDSCSDTSYVLVIKEGKDDYTYHGCLICKEDGYDNTVDDTYCDRTWLDPTKVNYGLGLMEDIYVYKGTTRDDLRNILELPLSYEREDSNGNIIATKLGTKEGDPTILPLNIDVVNTDVVGDYYVSYEYSGKTKERKVIVYENSAPGIVYKKQNTYAVSLAGDTRQDAPVAYKSGDWTQNVIVELTPETFVESGVTVSQYQWNKDNKWQTFACTGNPCSLKVSEEMNQTLQFRLIDSNGHISRETEPVIFKIDNTSPLCELEITTTESTPGWYNTNVGIKIKSMQDNKKNDNDSLVSGILYYNVQESSATLVRNVTTDSNTHSKDGNSITYIGYVEDKAENFNTCSITFKRDATKPKCGFTLTGTKTSSGWYTTDVGIEITTHSDNLSGVNSYGTGSLTGSRKFSHTTDITGASYTGHIKDNAGNTNTCSTGTFKRDANPPTCGEWGGESTVWTSGDRVISVGCTDPNGSGCTKTSYSTTISTGTTSTSSITLTIADNVGHTNTCTKTANVYVDKDDPSCIVEKSNTWEEDGVTTTVSCFDTGSEVASCDSGGTRLTEGSYEYSVTDNVGHSSTCSTTVDKQLQKRTWTCRAGISCTDNGCGTYPCNCGWATCPSGYQYYGTSGSSCCNAGGVCQSGRWVCGSCPSTCTLISVCGCANWGSPGPWTAASSCHAGEYDSHNKWDDCRTVYY